MSTKDWQDYFKNVSNILDLTQYAIMMLLLVNTVFALNWFSHEHLRLMCAFVGLEIWFKMFDWMRIFDSTAFYIKLIQQTFNDIVPFFMIFPIFLATFGTPIFILSNSREDGEEVVVEYFHFGLLDTMFNQYLLALGEFDSLEYFDGSYDQIIITLFTIATFCTCVTALNMIIAIMSDTFDSVKDHKLLYMREM